MNIFKKIKDLFRSPAQKHVDREIEVFRNFLKDKTWEPSMDRQARKKALEDDVLLNYGIVGNNSVRRTFKIPVGNMSPEESEKLIKQVKENLSEKSSIPYQDIDDTHLDSFVTTPIEEIKENIKKTKNL